MQRQMNQHEIEDAKQVLGWQHWAPPLVTSLFFVAAIFYAWEDELEAKIIMFVLLGLTSGTMWFVFLRNKLRVQRDIENRMIEIVEGPLKNVWKGRFGIFVLIDGKKIRVPAEFFKDLQVATTATIEYLPESRVALHIKPHYGLHLNK